MFLFKQILNSPYTGVDLHLKKDCRLTCLTSLRTQLSDPIGRDTEMAISKLHSQSRIKEILLRGKSSTNLQVAEWICLSWSLEQKGRGEEAVQRMQALPKANIAQSRPLVTADDDNDGSSCEESDEEKTVSSLSDYLNVQWKKTKKNTLSSPLRHGRSEKWNVLFTD